MLGIFKIQTNLCNKSVDDKHVCSALLLNERFRNVVLFLRTVNNDYIIEPRKEHQCDT